MKTKIFRIGTILALALAATAIVPAQQSGLEGVWNVSVTVTDCSTGALIRTVSSLQEFHHDGTVIETANTASRGISEGVYQANGWHAYDASYYFFRYTATGTFASMAKVTDTIKLVSEGHFTSTGTVLDYDANGNLLTTGCFIHTAYRLLESEPQR